MRAWWLTGRGRWCARALAGGLVVAPVLAVAVLAASPPVQVPTPAPELAPTPGLVASPAPVRHPRALRVDAWGGVLVDARTGVQVWGKDVNVARPMGSITKVLTALVILRAGCDAAYRWPPATVPAGPRSWPR